MNIDDLLKMNENDAIKLIKDFSLTYRIVGRDGVNFVHTAEFRGDRVDLAIKDGIVVRATFS